MNGKDTAFIKNALLKQRGELLKEANKTVEQDLNIMEAEMADSVDRSSVEADRSFTLRLRDRERKLLKKIDDALERLEGGSFGLCGDCGQRIGLDRLKARPVANLCINCKEEQERQEEKTG